MTAYLTHILGQSCIVAALAVSLNILAGYCGLVSLGQMTFYAIGEYSAALIAGKSGFGYIAVWPVALSVSAMLAVAEATVTAKLNRDEFAVATFAIHTVIWILLLNWVWLTHGPLGIPNVPPIHLFGIAFDSPYTFLALTTLLLVPTQAIIFQLRRQPFGLLMRMVRDNEALAENYGRDVKNLRRSVWLIAALIATAAGVLQASYIGYVNPISFSATESTMLFAIVILGGLGTFWGPIIGAFVVTLIPEGLRFIGFPTDQAANIRQILLGFVLVLAMFRVSSRGRESMSISERGR